MSPINRFSILIGLLAVGQIGALAESKPLELKWSELNPVITGHRVKMLLTDGRTIKGDMIAVREDSLLIDAGDASRAAIPMNSISLIKLEKTRGAWGRGLGATLGMLTGVSVGGYVAATQARSGGTAVAIFVPLAAAVAAGGYYVGGQLDRRGTSIKVVP
jgi:hypothetical protein